MTPLTLTLALVAVLAAALAAVAAVAWRRSVRDAVRRDERAAAQLAELRERLSALEARPAGRNPTTVASEREFVITHLGEEDPTADPVDSAPVKVSLTGPAFADAVVRETVVQTASVVHGLRRALAPETRNRIRFEMRRELKRSRKARKVEVREALREYRARHRTDPAADLTRPEDAA
jgi:type II secretory pathway pseudopilin PulG